MLPGQAGTQVFFTAAARAFEVLTLTTGIVVGIAAVLDLAQRAQVPLRVLDPATSTVPPAVALVAAAGMAASWAAATMEWPGSDTSGVPASDTSATRWPARQC